MIHNTSKNGDFINIHLHNFHGGKIQLIELQQKKKESPFKITSMKSSSKAIDLYAYMLTNENNEH